MAGIPRRERLFGSPVILSMQDGGFFPEGAFPAQRRYAHLRFREDSRKFFRRDPHRRHRHSKNRRCPAPLRRGPEFTDEIARDVAPAFAHHLGQQLGLFASRQPLAARIAGAGKAQCGVIRACPKMLRWRRVVPGPSKPRSLSLPRPRGCPCARLFRETDPPAGGRACGLHGSLGYPRDFSGRFINPVHSKPGGPHQPAPLGVGQNAAQARDKPAVDGVLADIA
jgi:hypothetical protein